MLCVGLYGFGVRRIAGILFAVAVALPVGLIASPAGAAWGGGCAASSGSLTFSPPVPLAPQTASSTVTGSINLFGCVGLGPTSGTLAFTLTTYRPESCDGYISNLHGTGTITWNTGQTSTISGPENILEGDWSIGSATLVGVIASGLWPGAVLEMEMMNSNLYGTCTAPVASITVHNFAVSGVTSGTDFLLPGHSSESCTAPQACDAMVASLATASAPALEINVHGVPASGTGTVTTDLFPNQALACPNVASPLPESDLTDSGFAPTDRLTVTETLEGTATSTTQQVCFNSTLPFKSVSSPTVPKPGPAVLLSCGSTANVPPCVVSSAQVGSDTVVTFVVPGGDPHFSLVSPKGPGTKIFFSSFGSAERKHEYSAQLQLAGGTAPVHWKVTSGKLPTGLLLNGNTGAITGIPTVNGTFVSVIRATDSSKHPRVAKITVRMIVVT
jgi:hypothetical protein